MNYERAKKSDLSALTALWHTCFGDPEADIQRFWAAAFDKITHENAMRLLDIKC